MKTKIALKLIIIVIGIVSFCKTGTSEPVRNGNRLALKFATNSAPMQKKIYDFSKDVIHTFRYLKVQEIKNDTPFEGAKTVVTKEPSSNLKVTMILTKPVSLKIISNTATGECLAAKGRIEKLIYEDKEEMIVNPAILLHKDRCSPKQSIELLREIDKDAH
jgi:hypothetical protein